VISIRRRWALATFLCAWLGISIARAQNANEEPAAPPTQSGLEKFHPGAKRAQWVECGCYDKPVKHFPYAMVVFELAEHDLIVRPERDEAGFRFVPLARRYGERYCKLESEQDCYGSFGNPCDFTDYRFGPTLIDFFPTCKTDGRDD
jgi:hypothetical protein